MNAQTIVPPASIRRQTRPGKIAANAWRSAKIVTLTAFFTFSPLIAGRTSAQPQDAGKGSGTTITLSPEMQAKLNSLRKSRDSSFTLMRSSQNEVKRLNGEKKALEKQADAKWDSSVQAQRRVAGYTKEVQDANEQITQIENPPKWYNHFEDYTLIALLMIVTALFIRETAKRFGSASKKTESG